MNNITELNKLIYAGVKLVCEKISVPLKNLNGNSKPGLEIQLETQLRNLWQAKMIKQKKNAGICWDKKKKSNSTSKTDNTTQRNEPDKAGERRKILRRDKTIQTKQDMTKQRKKFYQQVGEGDKKHTNIWMTRKQNNFETKYGNQEKWKAKWISNMGKEKCNMIW